MAGRSLAEWLDHQERLHPRAMDFTLDRIRLVLMRLGLDQPRSHVITVGGTNGKGSVTAMLEAVLRAGGARVGLYTSPHLTRYTERIRIDGHEISEPALLRAFERVEAARGDITLTFFEYATAAALVAFDEAAVDFAVLEVGLGGRLDAVNALDADVAVVASVGLDHCDYLGSTVDVIGREKAGIFRKDRPAIYGSREMPVTIASEAARIGARLERLSVDFDSVATAAGFRWQRGTRILEDLPLPGLPGPIQLDNAASALAALDAGGWLPAREACATGLASTRLPGRFEVVPGPIRWIFDVAHNPPAAEALARAMRANPPQGRWLLVAGILADKDAAGVAAAIRPAVRPGDLACAVTLAGERGRGAAELAALCEPLLGTSFVQAGSVEEGCAIVAHEARPGDTVLVFGSFHTVGPAREWHDQHFPRSP